MPAISPTAAAAGGAPPTPLKQAQPQLQQQQQQQQQQALAGPHDAADAAMYREMRQALCTFDAEAASGSAKAPAARHKAFYAALRSVLGQVLEENTEASRHTRLLAAHQWYVKHKPRPKPADMNMAAAMAASLSVQGPTEVTSTAAAAAEEWDPNCCSAAGGRTAGGGSISSPASNRRQQPQQQQQQQQQHPFRVLGVGQQASGAGHGGLQVADGAAAEQRQLGSSRSARWQARQSRMHELDCPAAGTLLGAPAGLAGSNHSCCSQCGAPLAGCCACSAHSACTAGPASTWASRRRVVVAECLPEQPSMRQVPAIAATTRQQMGASQADAAAGRLGGAAAAAAAAAAAGALPSPDGLIPLGSLPSGRFGLSSSSSSSNKSSNGDGASYLGAREQWRLVAAQQQEVEGAVASHMRSYARHRARLEEEINRKQEAAAQQSAVQQSHGCGVRLSSNASQGRQREQQAVENGGARALLHVDSQHQPSQVAAAYTGLAAAAGLAQRLVPVDRVKEAKQQLLQESQRECAEVAEHIARLGISADVQRALLPLPDQPYMSCMARLPRPGAAGSSAAKVKPGKKKKVKTKGAAKKASRGQAAAKKGQN